MNACVMVVIRGVSYDQGGTGRIASRRGDKADEGVRRSERVVLPSIACKTNRETLEMMV